jgi:thioredoxin 1
MAEGTTIMRLRYVALAIALFIEVQTVLPQKKSITTAIKTARITFVELGSVNCIPCRQMQPVMKAIEQKYGEQIKVIFHDVWKEDQKHFAQKYGIRLIPTQVFLDERGKELMRHEGFFPEKDIDAFLQSKGLKLESAKKDD